MTIGKEVAWWPGGVTLRARTGPSRLRFSAGLAGQGTLGVHESATVSEAQADLGMAWRPAEPSIERRSLGARSEC
eukprot:10344236-Alexandrium_andersonii.AAC.1